MKRGLFDKVDSVARTFACIEAGPFVPRDGELEHGSLRHRGHRLLTELPSIRSLAATVPLRIRGETRGRRIVGQDPPQPPGGGRIDLCQVRHELSGKYPCVSESLRSQDEFGQGFCGAALIVGTRQDPLVEVSGAVDSWTFVERVGPGKEDPPGEPEELLFRERFASA